MEERREKKAKFIPFSNAADSPDKFGEPAEADEDRWARQASPVQQGGYGNCEPIDPAQLIPERDAVQGALSKLPEGLRQVLVLSVVAGMPAKEVAASLGITEVAVRQRLFRARNSFREVYVHENREY